MIAFLRGTILSKGAGSIVLENNGVGYKVAVPASAILSLKVGQSAEFFIHTHVREDQISLYGFLTTEELELFELFISVSGIGPKMALSILSAADTGHIKSAIASGESAVFTKVSGVGRKTADRLIVELKEKIGGGKFGKVEINSSQGLSESLDALISLGYSQSQAREALARIPKDLTDSSQIIRAALKNLGGQK